MKINIPQRIRKQLFVRAKNSCEICGIKENLEVHHKKPKQQGINHRLSNLQLLCKGCHYNQGISNRVVKNKKIVVINETFTDEEHKKMSKLKNGLSWHDFILLMATHCLEAEKKGDFEIFAKGSNKETEKGK